MKHDQARGDTRLRRDRRISPGRLSSRLLPHNMPLGRWGRCAASLALLWFPVVLSAAESVDFVRDVAPIFERACLRCHAPGNAQGELSLATIDDLRRLEYLVAGDPESSYLIEVVSASDGERPRMPKEGEPLAAEQVAVLRRWIAAGAVWPEGLVLRPKSRADATWWSLRPLTRCDPPQTAGVPPAWQAHPIDRFLAARLAAAGLAPNPLADRRTLIRRVTYDLTGLPPAPEEVEAFVRDPDPHAYERLVDRLLASPHYGEHWGRHWLDVVRFGESNGYERNFMINDLWPFRDYVIRSLNEDKPFDQFLREHLAGDVLGPDQPDVEIGSAFLVTGPFDDVGNQDPVQAAQIRANTIDEIIRATGEAFLGLTIGCARCHDHKFDPILQTDYYGWYATFSGVRHGSRVVATAAEKQADAERRRPLEARRQHLMQERDSLLQNLLSRGEQNASTYEAHWTRPPVDRQGTEETFPPVTARFIRLVSEGQDTNPENTTNFGIDEFEVWSAEPQPRNVALAAHGGRASGTSRLVEDFPGAYAPELAIDGKTGARFLATGGTLTIEFAAATPLQRVVFSSARGETTPEHPNFVFVGEYRLEISTDGQQWTQVANSHDRQPVNEAWRKHRLRRLAMTDNERDRLAALEQALAQVNQELSALPPLPTVWVGQRVAADAQGPFHVFLGGNPQRRGEPVVPASLSAFVGVVPTYALAEDAPEGDRRKALADWMVHPANPLTPRVLANRLWHYHFGTGIVETPSDFGFMGGRPTHPELLDWLAAQIHEHGWRLKPLHRLIVLSQAYQQASTFREDAARVDGDARLLWRFPPRRLSAEEIRDTLLSVSGRLDLRQGGPGFRLYRYMQDNVATYAPLDHPGPETYRRAVYHHNARASVVDLMSDFDLPDCAFSTPRRAQTITPLQALTLLNHSFTLDMAAALAERVQREAGDDPDAQIQRLFLLCVSRPASEMERTAARRLVDAYGLPALGRVMLNTSELIHVQ